MQLSGDGPALRILAFQPGTRVRIETPLVSTSLVDNELPQTMFIAVLLLNEMK